MDKFVFERTLSSNSAQKLTICLGHLEGDSTDKKAILKIEKEEFSDSKILKQDENGVQSLNCQSSELFFENDIYTKYKCQFPECTNVNVEMIYPASQKLIDKYSEHQIVSPTYFL